MVRVTINRQNIIVANEKKKNRLSPPLYVGFRIPDNSGLCESVNSSKTTRWNFDFNVSMKCLGKSFVKRRLSFESGLGKFTLPTIIKRRKWIGQYVNKIFFIPSVSFCPTNEFLDNRNGRKNTLKSGTRTSLCYPIHSHGVHDFCTYLDLLRTSAMFSTSDMLTLDFLLMTFPRNSSTVLSSSLRYIHGPV